MARGQVASAATHAARMKIKEVIATLNRMHADGVLEHYAIGGAVGATFYLEPFATLDSARFQAILARHGLGAAWKRFEQQFLSDGS